MLTHPKTALVTGSTGFIGGHLVKRLLRDGWHVAVLVRDPARLSSDVQGKVDIIVGALADVSALERAVCNVSVVFHCAANVNTWNTAEAYHTVNVLGTKALLQAIRRYNPHLHRLVHLSTADVYGFPHLPCDENAATAASGFGYGDSKREGELLVQQFCAEHAIPYTIIRPCNVIGPGSQFIERIGKELRSGLMLAIDKGRANAGMVSVNTLVDYMVWAAGADNALSECYNVRDPYDVSWAQFINVFRKLIKGRGLVIGLPFGAADVAANACAFFYKYIFPKREPLLHPLIVRIFGRTCGHSTQKIRTSSGIGGESDFNRVMQESVTWFESEHACVK